MQLFNQGSIAALKFPRRSANARIGIVGGGFCGTLALVTIAKEYSDLVRSDRSTGPLNISWFDPNRAFARGVAYRSQFWEKDNEVFTLNQPAERMAPFHDDPSHYTRWLERQGLGNRYTFTSRATYGRYLESLLAETISQAPVGLRLQLVAQRVIRLEQTEQESIVHTLDGRVLTNDSVILALGHSVRDAFDQFRGTPGHLSELWNIQLYRELVQRNPQAKITTLIGGGPSTIDAIKAFEHVGFSGRYRIISAAVSQPWRFDPEYYSDSSFNEYRNSGLFTLSPEWIAENLNYLKLWRALRQNLRRARAAGFGDGHVYYSIDLEALERIANIQVTSSQSEQLVRFGQVLSHLRGSLTAPEGYALLRRLKDQGRMEWIKGRAEPLQSDYDASARVYRMIISGRTRQQIRVSSDLLVNCAQIGSARSDLEQILAGVEGNSQERVHLLGPLSTLYRQIPGQHGVERYRGAVRQLSLIALRQSLGANN